IERGLAPDRRISRDMTDRSPAPADATRPPPAPVPAAELEDRKARAAAWFAGLRDRICGAFEDIEDALTGTHRSEEHTSDLQSQMRISYGVLCLKKKKHN